MAATNHTINQDLRQSNRARVLRQVVILIETTRARHAVGTALGQAIRIVSERNRLADIPTFGGEPTTLHRQIDESTRASSLKRPGAQFILEAFTFGQDAVALGAALLPLEQVIEGHIEVTRVA